MTARDNEPAVKWTAELSHVREVALFGTANLDFWRQRLQPEQLKPVERDGRARLLIVGADSRFMGLRFQELSFSILVSPQNQSIGADAAYLFQAFNSRRLFAFSERALFSTPYAYAHVQVSPVLPACLQVIQRGEVIFRAEMEAESVPTRVPSGSGVSCWEGPIFLPRVRSQEGSPERLFFARLAGYRQTYPFLSFRDSLAISPVRECEALKALVDSRFIATEWAVRENATHARSKTYPRSEFEPLR